MRDHDTDHWTLVSIASRIFSDKRARPPGSCPFRHFTLHGSVLHVGLRGSGCHFYLPTHTAPKAGGRGPDCPAPHLPVSMHAFLKRTKSQSSQPQPGRYASRWDAGEGGSLAPSVQGWEVRVQTAHTAGVRSALSRGQVAWYTQKHGRAASRVAERLERNQQVLNGRREEAELEESQPSGSQDVADPETRAGAHGALVRCVTQHRTYPQAIEVGGQRPPCLNLMYNICMHNDPCQTLTGDGLPAPIS